MIICIHIFEQRKVAVLRFSIYKELLNGANKTLVAFSEIDLASIIIAEGTDFVGLLSLKKLPKSQTSRRISKSVITSVDTKSTLPIESNVFCCIMLGFRFSAIFKTLAKSELVEPELSNLKDSIQSRWKDIFTKYSLDSPENRKEITDSQLQHASSRIPVHVALGDMAITVPESHLSGSRDHFSAGTLIQNRVTGCINVVNDSSTRVEFSGDTICGTKVRWNQEDLFVSIDSIESNLIAVEINLYLISEVSSPMETSYLNTVATNTVTSEFGSSISQKQRKLGVCIVLLPLSLLVKGIPLNYQLPIRDSEGFRIALLSVSFQSSSIPTSPETVPINQSQKQQYSRNYICIEYLEGNISNNTLAASTQLDQEHVRHKEVFFESALSITSESSSLGNQYVSRTGYLTTVSTQNWHLSSRLSLPLNILSFVDSIVNDDISLCIICKDAGGIDCHELGRARISLPSGFFRSSGRSFEQWITFHHYSSADGKNSFSGRVKIRLTLKDQVNSFPTYEEGSGLGMIVCRFVGINSGRNGQNDEFSEKVVQAQIFSQVIPVSTSLQPTSNLVNDEEHYIDVDSTICQPIRYGSVFHRFSAGGELGGNASVYNGTGHITINLRSETATCNYCATVPIMKLVPKGSSQSETPDGFEMLSIPTLDLSLSRKSRGLNNVQLVSKTVIDKNRIIDEGKTDPFANSSVRLHPKLRFEGCFVPFVDGIILVQTNTLAWIGKPPIHYQSGAGHGCTTKLSVRFSMGYPSPVFAHSVVDALDSGDLNRSPNDYGVAALFVSTFELLRQEKDVLKMKEVDSSEYRSMLPMFVQVSHPDMESSFAKSIDPHFTPDDDRLCGFFYTAPLYSEAMRSCATGSIEKNEKMRWKVVQIDLYHKKMANSVGRLEIKVCFKMTNFPRFVMEPIRKIFFGEISTVDNARLELGLKQAFLLADVDKSNFVSASEVRIIMQLYNRL